MIFEPLEKLSLSKKKKLCGMIDEIEQNLVYLKRNIDLYRQQDFDYSYTESLVVPSYNRVKKNIDGLLDYGSKVRKDS